MAEPATSELQQANSPARQLLAALTRASQDMEKSVGDTCDFVTRLNNELDRYVSGQLQSADEQIEQIVRAKLDKASAEKEEILTELMEIRQAELQVLQQTGKQLRDALSEKLDALVEKFEKEIDENIKAFQFNLTETEKEIGLGVGEARKEFKDALPAYIKSVNDAIGAEKNALVELHAKYEKSLVSESASSLEELLEHGADLKGRLQTEGENYQTSVAASVENLTAQQTERLNQRIESFSVMQKKVSDKIQAISKADIDYIKALPASYQQSCKDTAELQVGLHATTVRNLALQYGTEILTAAQQAEDQLQIVRADLQSLLRNYQTHYSEQFESLLSKFRKAASELAQEEIVVADQSRDSEIVANINEQFANLKKEITESTKDGVTAIEGHMEKSYELFRDRLDTKKKEAVEKVELDFKESQNELTKLQQSNDEQMTELVKKLEELEQSVAEARELISALDEASLDF